MKIGSPKPGALKSPRVQPPKVLTTANKGAADIEESKVPDVENAEEEDLMSPIDEALDHLEKSLETSLKRSKKSKPVVDNQYEFTTPARQG